MAEEKKADKELAGDDEEAEGFVSLDDYIEAYEDLEDEAQAVLGDIDDGTCTYSQGYLTRQPIYSCVTCSKDADMAGICLACSLECHDGHELYELYTKRRFRCDCGNIKFEKECKLQKEKDATNTRNRYGHNFKGRYCKCDRPYPDPDKEIDEDMRQCCMCEDWYHDSHLQVTAVPDEFEEMICRQCVTQHSFLHNYAHSHHTTVTLTKTDNEQEVDVTSSTATESAAEQSGNDLSNASSITTPSTSVPGSADQDVTCEKLKMYPSVACKTLFMNSGWRETLCTCSQCKQLYKSVDIEYLLDPEDSVVAYERRSKNSGRSSSNYEKGMEALSSLGRTQQIELISGYNDMKTSLVEYLKNACTDDKVVKKHHIQHFFEEYNSKKPKLSMPPSNCS